MVFPSSPYLISVISCVAWIGLANYKVFVVTLVLPRTIDIVCYPAFVHERVIAKISSVYIYIITDCQSILIKVSYSIYARAILRSPITKIPIPFAIVIICIHRSIFSVHILACIWVAIRFGIITVVSFYCCPGSRYCGSYSDNKHKCRRDSND